MSARPISSPARSRVRHVVQRAGRHADGFDQFPPRKRRRNTASSTKRLNAFSINTADSVLNDVFDRLIFQVHPYRVPVLGYPDRFKNVTRDDVYNYYQQRYSPAMCAFVVVGDVDVAR